MNTFVVFTKLHIGVTNVAYKHPLGVERRVTISSMGCTVNKGGWYSGYIVIPQYYFEVITISCKIFLSSIIAISILSRFTEESLYALNYTN